MTQYDFEAMNQTGVFQVQRRNIRRATDAALKHFGLRLKDRARIWLRGSRPVGRSWEAVQEAEYRTARRTPTPRRRELPMDPFDREMLGLD